MTLEHDRLRELFIASCDLPELEQSEFLEEQCSDDPELRRRLEQLLRNDSKKGLFGDGETAADIQFEFDTKVDKKVPQQIGEYRVKKILGQGGMGIVYLAQQQNPVRDVAIKVIRSEMVSSNLLKRFELEAAVLGRLTHPGIAKIHEAGSFTDQATGLERPFLAMEFIEGQRLREFAKQKEVSTSDRLRLLVKICEAVNHAHQRGVIHRDLKPGNVLVKADGQPSILDFGVARATDGDPETPSMQTRVGQLIGTLPYMSPEQVSGNSLDVDTRSDVYALGVMAYELLSGELPYDVNHHEYLKVAKAISEDAPVPLSAISREFRGDLNTVVLKALEKNPDRRYESAKTFADDIQRFLDHQPVQARPSTAFYQLKQFAKRNKALVCGFLVSVLLLVAGIIGTTIGMVNARMEASRKNAVNEFMKDILAAEDLPSGNADIKMVEVLRAAAASAPTRFRDYPELEAEVSHLLGDAFTQLTFYSESTPLYQRAYEFRKSEFGLSDKRTREVGSDWANIWADRDARGTIDLATEILEVTPADEMNLDPALILQIAIARARVRLGKQDAAENQLRELIATMEGLDEVEPFTELQATRYLARCLQVKVNLGNSSVAEKDIAEAIKLYRETIVESEKLFGKGHIYTLHTMIFLVDALKDGGRLEEAETLIRQVIELAARFSPENDLNSTSKKRLAKVLYQKGSYSEAAQFMIEVVQWNRARFKTDSVQVRVAMRDGLPIVEAGKRFVEGEEYARILIKKLSGYGDQEITNQLYLARFLSAQGKADESKRIFERVVEVGEMETSTYWSCLFNLFQGEQRLSNGETDKAAELFNEALRERMLLKKEIIPTIGRFEDAIKRAAEAVSENAG